MIKSRTDFEIGCDCSVQNRTANIIGYLEWNGKLQYVWVKFQEVEELIKPAKVKLT